MKTYFDNDPDKQEMLEIIVCEYLRVVMFMHEKSPLEHKDYLKQIIERITKESIKEVLKS